MPAPREQFNCRLPSLTKALIADLAERLGLSQSEVVMLAVERFDAIHAPQTDHRAASKN